MTTSKFIGLVVLAFIVGESGILLMTQGHFKLGITLVILCLIAYVALGILAFKWSSYDE